MRSHNYSIYPLASKNDDGKFLRFSDRPKLSEVTRMITWQHVSSLFQDHAYTVTPFSQTAVASETMEHKNVNDDPYSKCIISYR